MRWTNIYAILIFIAIRTHLMANFLMTSESCSERITYFYLLGPQPNLDWPLDISAKNKINYDDDDDESSIVATEQ